MKLYYITVNGFYWSRNQWTANFQRALAYDSYGSAFIVAWRLGAKVKHISV